MGMGRILMALAGALLVTGCGPITYWPTLDEQAAAEYVPGVSDDGNIGFLVGSFAINPGDGAPWLLEATSGDDGFRYNSYRFKFRPTGDTAALTRDRQGFVGAVGTMFSNRYAKDFQEERVYGSVYATPLPAGTYEFYQFEVFDNRGTVQTTWRSTQEFSIPFEIQPGRAAYVGELMATTRFGRNLLGMTIAAGAYFDMRDAYERDRPLLDAKFPFLATVEAEDAGVVALFSTKGPAQEQLATEPGTEPDSGPDGEPEA